eukprot:Cvel_14256.t1-p1 / transcript=Cvel_14256.t1 / gene=Cvel_14256 / organism=Chromera_velia_CCMP2878 / gene_product=Translation initiation factor IF-2, putative / transcript_product=Translation initiation factor IF-2, putative / location=Cvel_scaffold1006:42847-45699(+) / protein_length=951 / sequence_SO=supercontig / SO=protein_coding / is_pseudo=false
MLQAPERWKGRAEREAFHSSSLTSVFSAYRSHPDPFSAVHQHQHQQQHQEGPFPPRSSNEVSRGGSLEKKTHTRSPSPSFPHTRNALEASTEALNADNGPMPSLHLDFQRLSIQSVKREKGEGGRHQMRTWLGKSREGKQDAGASVYSHSSLRFSGPQSGEVPNKGQETQWRMERERERAGHLTVPPPCQPIGGVLAGSTPSLVEDRQTGFHVSPQDSGRTQGGEERFDVPASSSQSATHSAQQPLPLSVQKSSESQLGAAGAGPPESSPVSRLRSAASRPHAGLSSSSHLSTQPHAPHPKQLPHKPASSPSSGPLEHSRDVASGVASKHTNTHSPTSGKIEKSRADARRTSIVIGPHTRHPVPLPSHPTGPRLPSGPASPPRLAGPSAVPPAPTLNASMPEGERDTHPSISASEQGHAQRDGERKALTSSHLHRSTVPLPPHPHTVSHQSSVVGSQKSPTKAVEASVVASSSALPSRQKGPVSESGNPPPQKSRPGSRERTQSVRGGGRKAPLTVTQPRPSVTQQRLGRGARAPLSGKAERPPAASTIQAGRRTDTRAPTAEPSRVHGQGGQSQSVRETASHQKGEGGSTASQKLEGSQTGRRGDPAHVVLSRQQAGASHGPSTRPAERAAEVINRRVVHGSLEGAEGSPANAHAPAETVDELERLRERNRVLFEILQGLLGEGNLPNRWMSALKGRRCVACTKRDGNRSRTDCSTRRSRSMAPERNAVSRTSDCEESQTKGDPRRVMAHSSQEVSVQAADQSLTEPNSRGPAGVARNASRRSTSMPSLRNQRAPRLSSRLLPSSSTPRTEIAKDTSAVDSATRPSKSGLHSGLQRGGNGQGGAPQQQGTLQRGPTPVPSRRCDPPAQSHPLVPRRLPRSPVRWEARKAQRQMRMQEPNTTRTIAAADARADVKQSGITLSRSRPVPFSLQEGSLFRCPVCDRADNLELV